MVKERTTQSLEDLLRVCVLEQGGVWDSFLPLIKFTYNNSLHSSIGITLFEAFYYRSCMTHLCIYELGEGVMIGQEVIQQITENIKVIQEKMRVSQSHQKSYHDTQRKSLDFQQEDHVF